MNMAVYDLEEQEQIDEFKAWWNQYRNIVTLLVVAVLLTLTGMQGWRYYQNRQALEAGTLYLQMQTAAAGNDAKKTQDIAAVIIDKYPRTTYASFAALAAAKAAFDSGDKTAARTRLQWVTENGRDAETRDIARLRLAAVLLDEKKYDEALKVLDAPHVDSLTALYADLKGDVLVAQNKPADARAAYQLALDKSEPKSTYRALIQVKLDALGSAK